MQPVQHQISLFQRQNALHQSEMGIQVLIPIWSHSTAL